MRKQIPTPFIALTFIVALAAGAAILAAGPCAPKKPTPIGAP